MSSAHLFVNLGKQTKVWYMMVKGGVLYLNKKVKNRRAEGGTATLSEPQKEAIVFTHAINTNAISGLCLCLQYSSISLILADFFSLKMLEMQLV